MRLGVYAIAGLVVAINDFALSSEIAPFGGVKASGYGREGSKYGLDEYLQTKYLLQGSLSQAEAASHHGA